MNQHNLDAVQIGSGEFYFSPGAVSLADARAKGFVDFGNITAASLKPELEQTKHEGSYRGKRREDKVFTTKTSIGYEIKSDEMDREKLKFALFGADAAALTQSILSAVDGSVLAFGTTAGVVSRWYDVLTAAGAHARELTSCLFGKAAASAVVADASLDTITLNAHGFVDGSAVIFGGTAAPAGLTAGTVYYVRDSAANTFKVAASVGGTAIDLTSAGTSVTVRPVLIETTDYVLDKKNGCVRFTAVHSANLTPIITAPAIVAGDAASLLGITPGETAVQSGFGRLIIYDDTHANKKVFEHDEFSCQVYFESLTDSDGKTISEITLKVLVTDTIGKCWSAE